MLSAASCDSPHSACLRRFLRSEAAKSFVGFVLFINGAVKDTPVSAEVAVSPAVEALTAAIDSLVELLEEIPPAQHALRYGNPAFRCARCKQPLSYVAWLILFLQNLVQRDGCPSARHAEQRAAARPARRAP